MGNNPSGFPYELGRKFDPLPPQLLEGEGEIHNGWEIYKGYLKGSEAHINKNKKENEKNKGKEKETDKEKARRTRERGKEIEPEPEQEVDLHHVTIFKTCREKSSPSEVLSTNLHHFSRLKTLKHPCILKYIDGVELEKGGSYGKEKEKDLILVTEAVTPLSVWLDKRLQEFGSIEPTSPSLSLQYIHLYQSLEDEIAWGFRCILTALSFLHDSQMKLSHCNITPCAIYVTRSGDWKLGSFELLCEWKEYGQHTQHYIDHSNIQSMWTSNKYLSPERLNCASYNIRTLLKDTPPGSLDVYAFGQLMDEIFTKATSIYNEKISNLNTGKGGNVHNGKKAIKPAKLSSSLAAILKRMKSTTAINRPTCTAIVNQPYFKRKPLNGILDFMEVLSLKEENEVMYFFESQLMPIIAKSYSKMQLPIQIQDGNTNSTATTVIGNGTITKESIEENDNTLPYNICIFKIFPLLRNYLHLDLSARNDEIGINHPFASSGKNGKDVDLSSPAIPHSPILIKSLPILMNLFCMASTEDFTQLMEGSVCGLFRLNDRAVRSSLLYALPNIANKISKSKINSHLFDATLHGLNDSLLAMRESTLKALISLTDKLDDKNLNEKLIRALTRLQSDPEPALRCNTTIFLGRIACQIKEAIRNRILLPSLLKGLKDDFPHSRLASLKAMVACVTYIDEVTICTQVLPMISLLLIDPESMVRDQAFSVIKTLTQKLAIYSEILSQEEAKTKEIAAQQERECMAQQQLQEIQQGQPQQQMNQQQGEHGSNGSSLQLPVKSVVSSKTKTATSTANSLATWAVQKLVSVDSSPSTTPTTSSTSSGSSVASSTTTTTNNARSFQQQPPLPLGPPPMQSRNSIGSSSSSEASSTSLSHSKKISKNTQFARKESEYFATNNNDTKAKGMKLTSCNLKNLNKISGSGGGGDGWSDEEDFFGNVKSTSISSPLINATATATGSTLSGSTSTSPNKVSKVETVRKVNDGWDDFDHDFDKSLSQDDKVSHGNHSTGISTNSASTLPLPPSSSLSSSTSPRTNAVAVTKINSNKTGAKLVTKNVKPQRVKAQKLEIEDDDWDF